MSPSVIGKFRISRNAKRPSEIHPLFHMKPHKNDSMMKHAGPNHVATRNRRMTSLASLYWGPLAIAPTIAPETPLAQVAYSAVPTGGHHDSQSRTGTNRHSDGRQLGGNKKLLAAPHPVRKHHSETRR